jgi:hypothetical protein
MTLRKLLEFKIFSVEKIDGTTGYKAEVLYVIIKKLIGNSKSISFKTANHIKGFKSKELKNTINLLIKDGFLSIDKDNNISLGKREIDYSTNEQGKAKD